MIAGLPVSAIPQCKSNRQEDTYLQLFQAIEHFERTFIEVQQASHMIFEVMLFKSQTKTRSLFEDIIISSN